MKKTLRQNFNSDFSIEKYQDFLQNFESFSGVKADFRLFESPVFLPKQLLKELKVISGEIAIRLAKMYANGTLFREIKSPFWSVPGAKERPTFIQLDFAIARSGKRLKPWLIELQGFPSLYFFQLSLLASYQRTFGIKGTTFFSGYTKESYLHELKNIIINGNKPEEVILLELFPEKQTTYVDFKQTAVNLGIKILGLHELKRKGTQLFYQEKGKNIKVKRIYNRIIQDELLTYDLKQFDYTFKEEVEVEWACHPDWFYYISKQILPQLVDIEGVPNTIFVNDFSGQINLANYVLKPVFSYGGKGVIMNPTSRDLEKIKDKQNWILQRHVTYDPVLHTPTGMAKCEIRLMMIWKEGEFVPQVANNVIRVSKGEKSGLSFNKGNDTWVGGSTGVF